MHDAVIIGGGHNGLTCAAYLAMAGLKVVVLERRGVVGGAAVTEEFHPGFRNSVASYTVSLLNPKVIRDLRLAELVKTGRLANRMRGLGLDLQRELLDLFTASAGHYLDGWFESAPIKAAYGFDGIVGNYASPYTPGSAYVLLHHCFGEVNGKKGAWGHAVGGMGAITQAMAKAAAARGAEIRLSSGVREVVVERGRAIGALTQAGELVRASAIVSNLNPKLLYLDLIDPAALPPAFRARIEKWRCGSGTFRMNVALAGLPDFTALPGRALAEHHTAGIIIAPSLAYMERAYADARASGWSRRPIVELVIASALDHTLAPPGRHVASL